MGRLTLNVLLSFAQFEREVTGERIRDKLAASKAKGMWMGGRLPLGYNPSGRTLLIDEAEAEHVRLIFTRFIALRSVDLLEPELASNGDRKSPTAIEDFLKGKLFDDAGHAIVSTTGQKGARRYRYYASTAALRGRVGEAGTLRRVTTRTLDDAVLSSAAHLLAKHWLPNAIDPVRVRTAVQRVELSARTITLDLANEAVDEIGLMAPALAVEHMAVVTRVKLPISLARRRNSVTLIGANGVTRGQSDDALIRAITRAKAWVKQLEAGAPKSIIELARAEDLCKLHTAKLLPLAFLAPDLVEMILDGLQPPTLTLTALIAEPLPESWAGQRARFAEFS